MSGVTLYCNHCRENHHLTAGEAEVVIHTLAAEWGDAVADLEPHPAHEGKPGWEVTDGWCALEHLRWVRDPEAYAELIEQAVECRRDHSEPPTRPLDPSDAAEWEEMEGR